MPQINTLPTQHKRQRSIRHQVSEQPVYCRDSHDVRRNQMLVDEVLMSHPLLLLFRERELDHRVAGAGISDDIGIFERAPVNDTDSAITHVGRYAEGDVFVRVVFALSGRLLRDCSALRCGDSWGYGWEFTNEGGGGWRVVDRMIESQEKDIAHVT